MGCGDGGLLIGSFRNGGGLRVFATNARGNVVVRINEEGQVTPAAARPKW
jgi:hypothetical protein